MTEGERDVDTVPFPSVFCGDSYRILRTEEVGYFT